MKTNVVEILLVEDNAADIELTRQSFLNCKLGNKLHVTRTGEDALNFLYKKGKFKSAPTPDMILLDLNLPQISGREVLVEIKHNDELKLIPVVILTASEDEDDIKLAYDNYANCYVAKPLDIDQFAKIIKSLNNFWFSIVEYPDNKN